MEKISHSDLQLLARHGDWREEELKQVLEEDIYAQPKDWLRFGRWLLLGAGAAFLLSGIVFFFAYNWADLHRFVKIGLVTACLVVTGLYGIFAAEHRLVRKVSLTAAVMLIGVLFAVVGQVYQTGADSYELFLSWTLFALPWVAVVHFAPLWLIFVALLNVTFITYTQQVGVEISYVTTGTVLFALNALAWLLILLLKGSVGHFRWLLQLIALWAAIVVTVNVSAGTMDDDSVNLLLAIILAAVTYAGWAWYAKQQRSIYYLAVIGGSVVIMLAFELLRNLEFNVGGYFVVGLLLLAGMTGLANALNKLNKRWSHAD